MPIFGEKYLYDIILKYKGYYIKCVYEHVVGILKHLNDWTQLITIFFAPKLITI